MSIKNFFVLNGLLVTCLFGSCSKDELTEPAVVNFEFSMNTELSNGKFLKFDQGELFFGSLEFDGDREAGQDVFFLSTFDNTLEADLDSKQSSEEVSFDIPQGIYKRIKLRIGDGEITSGPVIKYSGIYNSVRNGDIPVRIDFTNIEPIEIDAVDRFSSGDIVLNKEIPTNAELLFDPIFLFQISNSRQLESASISTIDGESVILISKDSNTVIFNIIISRLERSVSAIFN